MCPPSNQVPQVLTLYTNLEEKNLSDGHYIVFNVCHFEVNHLVWLKIVVGIPMNR